MLTDELVSCIRSPGASMAGIADLRGFPPEDRESLPLGISMGIALSPAIMEEIDGGPTAGYYAEYNAVNERLAALAQGVQSFLEERGFRAVGGQPTVGEDETTVSTLLPHKTVATRAGLGWIGKCALLVTRSFGSAVRLVTVLTDAPLQPGEPIEASRCGACTFCVDACPAGAVTGKEWQPGLPRESLIDVSLCRNTARELSFKAFGEPVSICGRCIVSCPFTKRYLSTCHE